jgi:ABC-type Na+ efflux pump permease subunit
VVIVPGTELQAQKALDAFLVGSLRVTMKGYRDKLFGVGRHSPLKPRNQAAAASLINRSEDLGGLVIPLIIPAVLALVLAQLALALPNSTNIVICSLIPLVSPFVMFARIAVSNVPAWQLMLSLAINLGGAVLLAWLSGKIYRVGMLLYGRAPSLRQIAATLRN